MPSTPEVTDRITETNAELVALHERWRMLPARIDMAIVGLCRAGWTQTEIAETVGVIGQEISRRVTRCADCEPGQVTNDPTEMLGLYHEFAGLPDRIDAAMAALADAGVNYTDIGGLIGVSKQSVSKRVKRHREQSDE